MRTLLSTVRPAVCELESCASCGRQFSCGAKLSGCWCAEVKLTDAARRELAGRFRGCLCRACLERFAAGAPGEAGGENLSDSV